jgi:A/G-specific adenine glycosylase
MEKELSSAEGRRAFRKRMVAWFRANRRDLPWRRTRDPYAVWVSEIMLQQTQVATVVPYFERFLAAFPTIAALAAADEEQVLRLWEGLGYYRRARQLHAAAKQIVAGLDGQFPDDPNAVRRLPGIGRYTAGAILSIAFDQREPILEANTIRLFTRLMALRGDPSERANQERLWEFAAEILPTRGSPGEVNQALMELGSLLCTPRDPKCLLCPVAALCPTRKLGLQAEIPPPKRPKQYEEVCQVAVIVRRRGRVLLRRCLHGERWAGLWDFPRFTVADAGERAVRRQIPAALRELAGVQAKGGSRIATLKHGVTRFRITLHCHEAECEGHNTAADGLAWVATAELAEYPLSVTGRKIARLIAAE